MPRFPASRLLRLINARHGMAFVLRQRYAAGEQGAYALADAAGGRYVLKWSTAADAGRRTGAADACCTLLRARDYPVPAYLYWGAALGGTYSIQTALPGTPVRVLAPAMIPRLLALNALQVDAAPAPAPDWPRFLVDSVLHGLEGYCELQSLRAHSTATAALLAALQRIASAQAPVACATGDIVHFDFNPANVLARRGTITGVVDWEGACAGDAAFDLATLLFYGYEQAELRRILWQAARTRASGGALALYLAHLCLRQVDWSIRYHDAGTVQRYLGIATAIVRAYERGPEVWARCGPDAAAP